MTAVLRFQRISTSDSSEVVWNDGTTGYKCDHAMQEAKVKIDELVVHSIALW